jgi:hypothetical protein
LEVDTTMNTMYRAPIVTPPEWEDSIAGQGELSRDGSTWEDDLAIAYRRAR